MGDLGIVDVEAAGVSLTVTATTEGETVMDNSTITDQLLIRAIITYVKMHFGDAPDYERLKASYDEQKAQMSMATGYTDWGDIDGSV